jgi:hypothetical protein
MLDSTVTRSWSGLGTAFKLSASKFASRFKIQPGRPPSGLDHSETPHRTAKQIGEKMSILRRTIVTAVAVLAMAEQAHASELALFPVQTGNESVRYLSGVPKVDLETGQGAVQISPAPFDHGHVSFRVAVYNNGSMSTNFGVENIHATIAGVDVPVLSRQELQRRAKSRAAWSQVGMALLAGVAAYGASQAYTTQTSTAFLSTPHGSYSWMSSYRDNSVGVLGAAAATAGGTAAIVGIQQRLDFTLANLASDIVQTTTVDPSASYGGRIVIEKPTKATVPYDVVTVITLGSDQYPFTFRVTHDGVSMPPPYTPKQIAASAGPQPLAASKSAAPIIPIVPIVPIDATHPAPSIHRN